MERKYWWINTGVGGDEIEFPPQYKLIEKEINDKFSPGTDDYGILVVKDFMTKTEAEVVYKEIVAIHEKYGGCTELVNMGIQPQCPKCDRLFSFSDSYCSVCGVELVKDAT